MKKLILLYGLPGSGKSTLSQKLKEQYESEGFTVDSVETDEWFVRHGNGVYKFDPNLLGKAHQWAYTAVGCAMEDNVDVIILANTNLTWRDIKHYVSHSISVGYDVEIVETETPWRYDIAELFRRGVHAVPIEVLERMNNKRQPIEYLREKVKQMVEKGDYEW